MKAIQFTKEQIEARENGASKFIVPIDETIKEGYIFQGYSSRADEIIKANFWNESIRDIQFIELPLQKGDEFFIQEEFWELSNKGYNKNFVKDKKIIYKSDKSEKSKRTLWLDASQMQEHQSRHKDTCLGIEVKRVQDLTLEECEKVCNYKDYRACYNLLQADWDGVHIEIDNPYIFLITYKGIQQ